MKRITSGWPSTRKVAAQSTQARLALLIRSTCLAAALAVRQQEVTDCISKISSQLNGVFRTLLDIKLPIDEMLERANRIFCERVQVIGYYATLVCSRATSAGTLELINAGHPPPLLLRSGGVECVESTGLPLGLFCASKYEVTHIQLTRGETLLFYTDGVTEARNRLDTEYGIERLESFVADKMHLAPKDLVCACRDDVSAFTSGAPLSDDFTWFALRRK